MQKHGLITQRYPGPGQQVTGTGRRRRDLGGMIEVGIDVDRVKLFQKSAEFGRHPLRQRYRDAGTDANDGDVADGTEAAEYVVDGTVFKHEWIAAGKDHITDGRG